LYLKNRNIYMVEVLLSGIVLGLVPVTILGLFVAAYLQYRRGNQFGI
jgi:cytochrome b6-f complex subunit 5